MIGSAQLLPVSPRSISSKTANETGAADISRNFSSFLNDAMTQLENQQATVNKLNEQFVTGNLSDVHQLMISAERASLGLDLTVQIRNKMIDAYQEVMRMQI